MFFQVGMWRPRVRKFFRKRPGRGVVMGGKTGDAPERQRSRAGMTLTEVMISVLVFSLGAGAIYALAGSLMRLHESANRTGTATRVAENRIEELMGLPLASVKNGTHTVNGYTVTDAVTAAATGEKQVRVTVAWRGVDNLPREVIERSVLIE
jgi:prepilin-type N-terminal cleavage/methylation domain-containing protein